MCHTVRKVITNRIDVMIIKTEAFEREFEQSFSEVIRIKKGSGRGESLPFFVLTILDHSFFGFRDEMSRISAGEILHN